MKQVRVLGMSCFGVFFCGIIVVLLCYFSVLCRQSNMSRFVSTASFSHTIPSSIAKTTLVPGVGAGFLVEGIAVAAGGPPAQPGGRSIGRVVVDGSASRRRGCYSL